MPMSHPRAFPGWTKPSLKWLRVPLPREVRPFIEEFSEAWDSPAEQLRVIRSWAPEHGWHLSMSHPSRYPTWDEIRDARYDVLPDECTVALLLPPKREYVNLHPNCVHLHQIED